MSRYYAINILDIIDDIGETETEKLLSDFSCPKNVEIENFVTKTAMDFAKRKISITYLIMDENSRLAGIFTVAHKSIEIRAEGLSNTLKSKISQYAQWDEEACAYRASAFLIAQLGKNYAPDAAAPPSGDSIMDIALSVLKSVQHDVGGGIVYLECEDKPQLLSFYQNGRNRFHVFSDRYSAVDNTKYIQLLRKL